MVRAIHIRYFLSEYIRDIAVCLSYRDIHSVVVLLIDVGFYDLIGREVFQYHLPTEFHSCLFVLANCL